MRNKWGQEVERPPWYGGNKIPESHLRKFGLRSYKGDAPTTQLPMELEAFVKDNL